MDVSILIGTYGEEHWSELALARAYPSACAQDAYEVVVGHDDDATIAQVRNALVEKARGDWLCFLDADDELAPGYLDAMRRAFEKEPDACGHLLLTPAVQYVRPNGRAMPPKFWPGDDLSQDNYLVVGTLINRDLFLSVGGFEDYPHGFEDWSLWAKCWKAGARIVRVKRAVYRAFVNPQSKHRTGWKDREWQVAQHQRVQRDIFPELFGET